MKNIKTILPLILLTLMANSLQAQAQSAKTTAAKPEEQGVTPVTIKLQTAPDTKPNPDITGAKQQTPAKANTEKQAADKKEAMPKPQAMDSKRVITTPAMTSEKRSDAKKAQPVLPAQDPNIIPATATKPVTIPQQQ